MFHEINFTSMIDVHVQPTPRYISKKIEINENVCFFSLASRIRYEITSGNIGGAFAVKNMTGAIYVAGALDYETRKRVSIIRRNFIFEWNVSGDFSPRWFLCARKEGKLVFTSCSKAVAGLPTGNLWCFRSKCTVNKPQRVKIAINEPEILGFN